jgi:hypothetical protein
MDPAETMVGTARGVGIWIAPEGTAPPADLDSDFTTPWLSLGYASDDGVTIGGDTSTESFTPWQSVTPIKTIVTERTRTVGFTMWQLNETTLGLYFDQDLSAETGSEFDFDVRSDSPQQIHAIGVDVADGERRMRLVYPRATIESTGDMTLSKGAMVPLEVTLSALDDAGTMVHVWVGAATGAVAAQESGQKETTQQPQPQPASAGK